MPAVSRVVGVVARHCSNQVKNHRVSNLHFTSSWFSLGLRVYPLCARNPAALKDSRAPHPARGSKHQLRFFAHYRTMRGARWYVLWPAARPAPTAETLARTRHRAPRRRAADSRSPRTCRRSVTRTDATIITWTRAIAARPRAPRWVRVHHRPPRAIRRHLRGHPGFTISPRPRPTFCSSSI